MTAPSWFWIVFVIIAAAGQTGRNVVQRALMTPLGAWGATAVVVALLLVASVILGLAAKKRFAGLSSAFGGTRK